MPEAFQRSPARPRMAPVGWHALPLTRLTEAAIMDSFSHYENFSYDEQKGGFLVELPVPPGRGRVSRATPAVLRDHVEVSIELPRGRNLAINQARRLPEECYSWWLGQLIHYGLPLVLSTDEAKQAVKSRILAGDLKVPNHLRKMEQRMRTTVRRQEKIVAITSANRSTSKALRKNVKVELGASDSKGAGDIIRTPSRKRSQGKVKIEAYASSESDSAGNFDSSDAETDSYEIENVSSPTHAKTSSRSLAKYQLAIVKTQVSRSPKLEPSLRKVIPESSTNNSSPETESDDGDLQDIPHDAIGTEEDQNTPEADSDYENGNDIGPADTKILPSSHNSEDENADGGSFSGNLEYERAVVFHSQAIDGARVRYGDADTDSSSTSSYNTDTEILLRHQLRLKEANDSSKATKHSPKSDQNSALKLTINNATPKSTTSQFTRPKQLEIKRDRRPRPEELQSAYTREKTPSRTPKKRTKQDHQDTDAVEYPKPAAEAASVHPTMTYEDIRDPIRRQKIARIRSRFPRQTIYLCYVCLAKHNDDYEESCQEFGNASLALPPERPTQSGPQDGQAPSSGRKRRRSSIPKQATAPKLQDPFALSGSDEAILQQEPTTKRRKASRLEKRASLISDTMHGSQIDLTVLDDAENVEEVKSDTPAEKRGRKRGSHNRETAHDKSSPKPLQAVSVEIPWLSAAKLRTAERERNQSAFPSSPRTGTAPKGILKSSPSFRSRKSLQSQAPDSAGPPLSNRRKRSSDRLPHLLRRNSEPDLPPRHPLRKAQQKVAPQHQVSWNPYATVSGPQAFNPNRKSKMRPSGQIEEDAQPEARRTLFPQETNRIIGLSRQDGGGLLERGTIRNPSISNRTSTKKKHREKGF